MRVQAIAFQGLLLGAVALFIRYATRNVILKSRPQISLVRSVSTYLIVVSIFSFFYLISFPDRIASTDPQVAAAKLLARESCQQAQIQGDWDKLHQIIHENKIGHDLQSKYFAANTFARFVALWANVLIFGMGAMLTITPFLVQMTLAFLSKQAGFTRRLAKVYPLRHQSLTLPLVFGVTLSSIVIFSVFHIQIEEQRSVSCVLFSGHWFTFFMITLMGSLILSHLSQHDGWYGSLTTTYLAFFVGCEALIFKILQTTQQFYHDNHEAVGGIRIALVWSPLILITFLVVEYFGWQRFAQGKKLQDRQQRQNHVDQLPEDIKAALKQGGISKEELLQPEILETIQATVVSYVKTLQQQGRLPLEGAQKAAATTLSSPVPQRPSEPLQSPPPQPKQKTETTTTATSASTTPVPPPPPPASSSVLPPPPDDDTPPLPLPELKPEDIPSLFAIPPPPPPPSTAPASSRPSTTPSSPPPSSEATSPSSPVNKPSASMLVAALKTLNKVTPPEAKGSSGKRGDATKSPEGSLANVLLKAIEERRASIEVEVEEEEDGGWDD